MSMNIKTYVCAIIGAIGGAVSAALGGWDNISNLESCITRIRLDAANTDLIDEAKLREAGAFDVVIVGDAVRVFCVQFFHRLSVL